MHIAALCTWGSRSEDFVTCRLVGQYLLVVIFLPLTVLVEVDTDRKLPMLPPPPPPKEVDEKEVKPPPPILPIVVMWPMWPIWPTALMEPKEPKAKSKKLMCLIHLSKRSTLPTVVESLCSSVCFTLANSLPGSKGEKPAPKAGKPKPPKKGPPDRLRLARPWCRRPLPKNESSLNGSGPERRKSQSARIAENHSRRPKVFKHAVQRLSDVPALFSWVEVLPKKSANGSLAPKNSLKTSSGLRNVKGSWKCSPLWKCAPEISSQSKAMLKMYIRPEPENNSNSSESLNLPA